MTESRESTFRHPSGRVPVVVVTGSESTGKTTLARDLARHFGTVWVPEYARTYFQEKMALTGSSLDATDVEPIARGQMAAEDHGKSAASELLVLDTDLTSTAVYAGHYYGSCPPWIEQAARDRRADLYLLCDIDVPWVPGPPRDRPDRRDHIHDLFAQALDALGVRYVTIRGTWEERQDTAIVAIRELLSGR